MTTHFWHASVICILHHNPTWAKFPLPDVVMDWVWPRRAGVHLGLHLQQYLLGPTTWHYENVCHIKEKMGLWRRWQLSMLGWHLDPCHFTVGLFSYTLWVSIAFRSLVLPQWHLRDPTKYPTGKLFPSAAHGHVYTGQSHNQNFCPQLCVPAAQNHCWSIF